MPAMIKIMIKATPPITPPTIAPTFNSSLVAATEEVVEAAEVVVEATEVGVEVAIGFVELVDWGTGDDSGPPSKTRISECRPIG